MSVLAIISLISFAVAVLMGTFAIRQDHRNLLNWIFLFYCLSAAYLAIAELGSYIAITPENAAQWLKAGSLWPFVIAFLVHYGLLFTKSVRLLGKALTYFVIYAPALAFVILDLTTGLLQGEPVEQAWGWGYNVPEDTSIYYLPVIWASLMGLSILYLCLRHFIKTKEITKRRQAQYVLLGIGFPMVACMVTGGLLPAIGIQGPGMTATGCVSGSVFIAFAIVRYRLFPLNPTTAAEQILSTMTDPVILVNPEGKIVQSNDATLKILGYVKSELIGQPLRMILESEDEVRLGTQALIDSDSSGATAVEVNLITKSNEKIPVSLSWTPVHDRYGTQLGTVHIGKDLTELKQSAKALQEANDELDMRVKERTRELERANRELHNEISERKRIEEALRESEQKYRTLFDNALDGIFVTYDDMMRIQICNKAAATMYGFNSATEAIGKNLLDYVHPEDRERALDAIITDAFEKQLNRLSEFRSITKDGRDIWVSTLSTKMISEGKITRLISVRDITKQKHSELEKERIEQQLQLAGRLAAVGELAAGVAHEVNNPLTAVQAFAELLVSDPDLDGRVKEDIEVIYSQAQRAAKITSNLLSFARRHRPEKRLVSINHAISKTLELHEYRMKVNNIDIVQELDPNLPETMADFHQLQQIFFNLITNAEQAMTDHNGKGTITIRTEVVEGMITISLADDGPGIPEENIKKIFDPFFTTKEVGKGTGLGLSICFGLVKSHDGNLLVQNNDNGGATFVIQLPIITEEEHSSEQSSVLQTASDHNKVATRYDIT